MLFNLALCQCCRILQQTETDQTRLRSLSGAWFREERSKRHRTWSGSALVHATIRHRNAKSRGPFSVSKALLLQAYCYRDIPVMVLWLLPW